MPRQSVPVPELLTAADVLRLILAAAMIPLGIVILTRTFSLAPSIPGALVGFAFIAFGSYRLWLGWSRYRLYRGKVRESRE